MNHHEVNPQLNALLLVIVSALLGLDIAVTLTLLNIDALDPPLVVAMYACSVSVPLLTGSIVMLLDEKHAARSTSGTGPDSLFVFGVLASIVAMGAIFFHFSDYAGWLFLASSGVALAIGLVHGRNIKKEAQVKERD